MVQNRYWFARRTTSQGSGFVPISPAGWIAIIVFVIIDGGGTLTWTLMPSIMDAKPWLPIAWALGWLAPFIALLYAKCEPKR